MCSPTPALRANGELSEFAHLLQLLCLVVVCRLRRFLAEMEEYVWRTGGQESLSRSLEFVHGSRWGDRGRRAETATHETDIDVVFSRQLLFDKT